MSRNLPTNHRRPWSDADKEKLKGLWGAFRLVTLAKRFDRTPWGVSQMARKLKLGRFSRGGGISMREFERYSGFSSDKIEAAAEALGMPLDRITASDPAHGRKHRAFMIDEDQQDALLKHMFDNPLYFKNKPGAGKTTKGVWGVGKKPQTCLTCSRSDRPHFAKGRCKVCYTGNIKKRIRMSEPIKSFSFLYRFLSNFHPSEVEFEGALYSSTEHAFQAAKTLDLAKRAPLQMTSAGELATNPGKAKRWGRAVTLRPDWEDVKLGVMETLLREKFTRHPDLAELLLATGDRELIEGNTWGDRFWGQCEAEGILSGDNHLGKLLMKIRTELRG